MEIVFFLENGDDLNPIKWL